MNGVWVAKRDSPSGQIDANDAAEACLSLGYTAGAQMLGNDESPLPGSAIFDNRPEQRFLTIADVVLICSNPSGEWFLLLCANLRLASALLYTLLRCRGAAEFPHFATESMNSARM